VFYKILKTTAVVIYCTHSFRPFNQQVSMTSFQFHWHQTASASSFI